MRMFLFMHGLLFKVLFLCLEFTLRLLTLSENFNFVFSFFFCAIGYISKVIASAFSHQKILRNLQLR